MKHCIVHCTWKSLILAVYANMWPRPQISSVAAHICLNESSSQCFVGKQKKTIRQARWYTESKKNYISENVFFEQLPHLPICTMVTADFF